MTVYSENVDLYQVRQLNVQKYTQMKQNQLPEVIEQVYFVPPPINQFNPDYHLQFENDSNPFRDNRYYANYHELLEFDRTDNHVQATRMTAELKQALKRTNRNIYSKMIECFHSLSGNSKLEKTNQFMEPLIKKEIGKFMNICEEVKEYEGRRKISLSMNKQVKLLRERTKQIVADLSTVKRNFQQIAKLSQKTNQDE